MLIALEGPNGVGKSTIAECLVERLVRLDRWSGVLRTKEPTSSEFGNLIRRLEADFPARALGLACAADRLYHLASEIDPAVLKEGAVVTDRYLSSSLVLQGFDGINANDIWSWNAGVRAPDLTVYLEDDPSVIEARIAARANRSRYESTVTPADELDAYRGASAYLASRGWRHVFVDCNGRTPDEIVDEIIDAIR
jgi:dTMP kinase